MTTMSTIPSDVFRGGSNLNPGSRDSAESTILEEYLAQAKVDIVALETRATTLESRVGASDHKDSVRLATAGALNACTAAGEGVGKTLTQDSAAVENIDGQAVVVGDRILVKNQVAGKDNGIYVVTVVGTGSVAQVLTRATDADSDAEVTASMMVPVAEGDVNANTHFMLTTDDPIVLDTTALTFSQYVSGAHATGHITSGGDEVDGDQLDIDLTPSYYTPDTTPAEVSDADHLGAHLAGIDNELLDVTQMEGSAAVVQLIQSDQPVANDTLVVGADTYEADGTGVNINFAIGGSAEATMDNLLAAAVASGTEDLYWDKLSATTLRLRNADAPQGNVLAGDQSIALNASSLTNYDFDVGDVNMNTLAGQDQAKTASAMASITVTTAMISGASIRVAFPFTPTRFMVFLTDSTGLPQAFTADTCTIDDDDILVTTATDFTDGDILTVLAYA